jgi:sigma-E factor negative regulatory protein RseB
MRRFGAGVFSTLLMLGSSLAIAADEAEVWLQRLSQASNSLNFEGVFVYQSQGRSETSRVVRLVDASGERERLETLDGAPREVVRHNDQVYSYLPENKVLVLDRVPFGRQPGRLSINPAQLREYYQIRLEGNARVAGRDTRVLSLEPRDELRYGHVLWIDAVSGLLLKARMRAGRDGMVEQFMFTEIVPGGVIDPVRLQATTQKTADWRVLDARGQELRSEAVPWQFRKLPAGFSQVALVRRVVRRDGVEAIHAVFSDGLVNVSVFIEAVSAQAAARSPDSAILAGSTGIYRRVLGEHVVTVMGEVPESALRMVAYGVERRKN